MEETAERQTRRLKLDKLTVNPKLARLLPPVVACRYHALPVAEANGHITVAMADPDDPAARDAVAKALGAPSCVVGGDPATIDALLAEIWPEMLRPSRRLLACAHGCPSPDQVMTYTRALGDLLNAHVSYYAPLGPHDSDCTAVARVVNQNGYDLVIWSEPEQPLSKQLLSGPLCHKAVNRIRCSLLVVRRPRWPLKRLLLIVQGEEEDDLAVDWVVRFARLSGATVTVLAVVPPVPAMFAGCAQMQYGLDALLTNETALGQKMRRVARWLAEWEVEGTLRLRQGAPDEQIRREVSAGDYDLITAAVTSHRRAKRWLMADIVTLLLRWVDRPVLLAKPTTGYGFLSPN